MAYWSDVFGMFRISMRVLRSHPRLMVFPVLSGIMALLVAAAFLTPAFFSGSGRTGSILLGLGCVLGVTVVTTFFKAALISQADVALRGGDARIGSGLAAAGRRWPHLLAWSLCAVTVSLVLRAIESQLDFLGRFLGVLAEIGWNLIAYLVLPILTLEDIRLRDAPKRSAELFRRTWGENIAGQVGLGVLGLLGSAVGVAAVLGLGSLLGGRVTLYVCAGLCVVWVLFLSVLVSALGGVYQTALYRFAADGTVPGAFADADLEGAFTTA